MREREKEKMMERMMGLLPEHFASVITIHIYYLYIFWVNSGLSVRMQESIVTEIK